MNSIRYEQDDILLGKKIRITKHPLVKGKIGIIIGILLDPNNLKWYDIEIAGDIIRCGSWNIQFEMV